MPWTFDVSSFMVLVGESEEYRYRAMRRSIVECLAAAPVAGIQTYLHSISTFAEETGHTYFSPIGMKSAPLRNMRLAHSIHTNSLLHDGHCHIYRILAADSPTPKWRFRAILWTLATWVILSGILVGLTLRLGLSWIGYTNVSLFVGWSVLVRLLDRYCIEDVAYQATRPDDEDAVFILGRRNSCLVLEGRRQDVARWTGCGVVQKSGWLAQYVEYLIRFSALLVILFVFITIPNGTTWDQVAFIAINLLGQLNVLMGQRIAAEDCFSHFHLTQTVPAPRRTHVYAFLLRKFGDGEWVETAGILPTTKVWQKWRTLCVSDVFADAKELYEQCLDDSEEVELLPSNGILMK